MHRSWRRSVTTLAACATGAAGCWLVSPLPVVPAQAATPSRVPYGATAKQSKLVLGCLSKVGLAHVSAASKVLWSAWYGVSDDFVYVYMYPTKQAAAARAHAMAAEEVAPAGEFLVVQPTARYSNSPVPQVANCLLGRRFHKPKPKKQKGTLSF